MHITNEMNFELGRAILIQIYNKELIDLNELKQLLEELKSECLIKQ